MSICPSFLVPVCVVLLLCCILFPVCCGVLMRLKWIADGPTPHHQHPKATCIRRETSAPHNTNQSILLAIICLSSHLSFTCRCVPARCTWPNSCLWRPFPILTPKLRRNKQQRTIKYNKRHKQENKKKEQLTYLYMYLLSSCLFVLFVFLFLVLYSFVLVVISAIRVAQRALLENQLQSPRHAVQCRTLDTALHCTHRPGA